MLGKGEEKGEGEEEGKGNSKGKGMVLRGMVGVMSLSAARVTYICHTFGLLV